MIESALPADAMASTDPTEPMDPTDAQDPIDPMDSTDPFDAMHSTESSDHNDQMDRRERDMYLAIMRVMSRWRQLAAVSVIPVGQAAGGAVLRDRGHARPVQRLSGGSLFSSLK